MHDAIQCDAQFISSLSVYRARVALHDSQIKIILIYLTLHLVTGTQFVLCSF